jgi:serine/threonine protein kinase
MPAPAPSILTRFREALLASGLVDKASLNAAESAARAAIAPGKQDDAAIVRATVLKLIERKKLTRQQAEKLLGSSRSPLDIFSEVALASGLVTEEQLRATVTEVRTSPSATAAAEPDEAHAVAAELVLKEILTKFQAEQMLLGRKRFRLGQYRILDQIGRGGMGTVFLAEHELMGRQVAIKVLSRKKTEGDPEKAKETEEAFLREIKVLSRLDHSNLVRALDAGYDGMVFFLVTELVPGLDLNRQVKRHGVLDEVTAASVFSQAAAALGYAHTEGVIHRDVKPGNIVVTDEGVVKLLDLGLANSMVAGERVELNRIVGTMDYIAPEQIQNPDHVGPSADIYSLGCTLYFAVTGRPPFPKGEKKDKASRHLHEKPPKPEDVAPHLSRAFCDVISGMMLKEPADRYQTMDEVITELQHWQPEELSPMVRDVAVAGVDRPPVPTSDSPSASGVHGNDTGNGEWLLDDAASLGQAGSGPLLEPPGREEVLLEVQSIKQQALRIAGVAVAVGAGVWLVAAVIAKTAGFGSIVGAGPILFGLGGCLLTAFGMSMTAALRPSN